MSIEYYTKNVYGETKIYLADPEMKELWQRLSGQKTITVAQMENLAQMTNITFVRIFEPVEVQMAAR